MNPVSDLTRGRSEEIVCLRTREVEVDACPVPEPVATAPRPAAGRSCGSVIFVDESAEYASSLDRHRQIDCPVWLVVGCLLLSTLVWPMLVVVRLPFGQYAA